MTIVSGRRGAEYESRAGAVPGFACAIAAAVTARQWVVMITGLMAISTSEAAAQSCKATLPPVPLVGLSEASGVAASGRSSGLLWSHNDSGEPVVFALTGTGEARGRTRVAGAQVRDWEALSTAACPGGTCLYVGDIGDNYARRGNVSVYRVPEPQAGESATASAEVMRATYPDGSQDAEAMFVTRDGSVYIVTKGEHGPVGLYGAGPFSNGTAVELQRLAILTPTRGNGRPGVSAANKVTDASASPDGRWIAVRTRRAVAFFASSELTTGTVREVFRYDLRGLGEPQGEGVAFADDGALWLTSEGGAKARPGLLTRLECSLP